VRGIVRDVEPAHRPSKGGKLDLAFDALYLGRARLDLRASVISMDQDPGKVGTAGKAGIGAVLGGVIGGLFGGKNGAIAGTILGGSGAVVGTKGDEVNLPEGTLIRVRLDRPLTVPLG
jgi:outer membrane lipoprotein SlyB